jgi:hypothetical protein
MPTTDQNGNVTIPTSAGSHNLSVSASGYDPISEPITVSTDQQSFTVSMNPSTGLPPDQMLLILVGLIIVLIVVAVGASR